MVWLMRRLAFLTAGALLGLCPATSWAARVQDLCELQGARGNTLTGVGLVAGLAGTGDKSLEAIRAQERMLNRLDIDVTSSQGVKSDNAAVVIVRAVLPAFAKEGTRIDVQVSSIFDAESLEGGTLLDAYLYGEDDRVYAVGQGPISVGGFNVSGGGGTSVRRNHVTAGVIPMGAYVEREAPSRVTDGERISLLLKRPDFGTARNIQDAVNEAYGPGVATALGAGTINVIIPETERGALVSFIAAVQDLPVNANQPARVVINERTGTIVVGGDVTIRPCQVAHGSLTIKVAKEIKVDQPPPLSPGETVVVPVTQVEAETEEAYLMPIEGTSASEIADALNALKVTPRDMIAIFQALREAGALNADLEIM